RKTDRVARIGAVGEVQDGHDVVSGATAIPAMERNQLVVIVDVEDVHVLAAKTARVVEPIPPQVGQVGVKLPDAAEAVVVVPVEALVAEGYPGQDLLTLADHRNARGREREGGAERRTLLRD